MISLVTPLAKDRYERREEQNFREFVRRNVSDALNQAQIANEALRTYLPVTPQMFGAVGDGVANDSAAIQMAIDSVAASGSGDITFLSDVYFIGTTTITIPHTVGVSSQHGAALLYSGTGVALDIFGGGAGSLGGRRLQLPNVTLSLGPVWDAGTDTTSRGIQLNACQYDMVSFGNIRNFRYGLTLKAISAGGGGSSGNCVCNSLNFGQIINCWRGVDFVWFPAGPWGVNQNTFIGGTVRIDGAWNHEAASCYVYMPDAENNTNTFVGMNLERGGNAKGIYCNSAANLFLNCRVENGTVAAYVEFGALGSNNKFISHPASGLAGNGNFATGVLDGGSGNMFIMSKSLSSKFFTLNFETGKIFLGSGAAAPLVPFSSYGTNRFWFGDTNTLGLRYYGAAHQEERAAKTAGGAITINDNFVDFNAAGPITVTGFGGIPIDATCRMEVTLFDVVGNVTIQHTAGPADAAGKFVNISGANKALTAKVPVRYSSYKGNLYEVA